ncbi:MAG: alanine--tRNA ligase, partial [Pseudomonadota bacterium]
MDSNTIRKKFLDYFGDHDHEVIRSSSIVPANDPTLYFTNAGMVQFKDIFSGEEHAKYPRASSSQKCLRVSGKHNDLENVGRTSRHHTFFEMLGNFSFGDYFKREAINLAWDFLTRNMGLDADRFVATVFRGEDSIPADNEAFEVWKKDIGLTEDRIFRLDKSDNFWAMGDVGPCGPCSELHYFQGEHHPCPEKQCRGVACECDRWVEIWNLVFMQFNRLQGGELTPLKATGVDTGMGLERLAAVAQGVSSTYETDLLRPIINVVGELAQKNYGVNEASNISLRVIADHARATAFCIADGVFPEKAGREYVLRRIMRRAIRHGKLLGFEEPFFHQVCAKVVELMGGAYPELVDRAKVIDKVVQAEERAFRRTLVRGLSKLHEAIHKAHGTAAKELDPGFVGDLYATDGFPIDLTRIIAEENALRVDEQAAHQWVTRTHGAGDTKVGEEAVAGVYKQLVEKFGSTEFLGYEHETAKSKIIALVHDGKLVETAQRGSIVEMVTAATPFYSRAGGQIGDTGIARGPNGSIRVTDTIKPGGTIVVHQGEVVEGSLNCGETVELAINKESRQAIRLNHSATHLLHHSLREVLGDHVAQKGSEVAHDHLRFDFSHFQAMTDEEIERVEFKVNGQIRLNAKTSTEVVSYENAREQGATALFGEKYGDKVRMVRIGTESIELCGGTHTDRTGDIGLFRIISEEALALGVRRIVALTGETALVHDLTAQKTLRVATQLLRTGPEELPARIERLLSQAKDQ